MSPQNLSNIEYWAERFRRLEESTFSHIQEWIKSAERQFRKSLITIKEKVAQFYQQFENVTGMSLAEAKRAMDKKSLKEFKFSVEEYIKMGESLNENFDPDVLKQMIIASDRVRVSRYEAIQWQIEAEVAKLHGEFQADAYDKLGEAYENRYYQTAYEMRSLGFSFARLNKKQIQAALNQPWREGHFSTSIWSNQKKLIKSLTDVITQAVITGKSYTEATKALEEKMKTGSNNAARIISTEMAAISSQAQQDMFEELDVKKYVIVATLDDRTSQLCQSLDGEVFNQKDYKVGETAPPFHVNCRSTTAPYFNDMKPKKRVARKGGDGRSEFVDNTKYYEWAKKNNIKPVYGLWEPPKESAGIDLTRKSRLFDLSNPKDVAEIPNLFYYDIKGTKATKINIGHKPPSIYSSPNDIIDHFDQEGRFKSRKVYDKNGDLKYEIHQGDHLEKGQPYNHKHIWYKNDKGKLIKEDAGSALTEKDIKENGDIEWILSQSKTSKK